MDDLIVKYKRGEKGVKIYATGRIVHMSGEVLAVLMKPLLKLHQSVIRNISSSMKVIGDSVQAQIVLKNIEKYFTRNND